MKEEDLIYSLSKLDADIIEDADPLNATGLKTVNTKHGMPKMAAAAIVFACVLVLGGGVVWAMTASPLKEYFFKNSDKEFEDIYTEAGKEYKIGSHTVVFDGAIYDESVDTGYVSFSAFDEEGNPVTFDENLNERSFGLIYDRLPKEKARLVRNTNHLSFKLGEDEGFIIWINAPSMGTKYSETSMCFQFKSESEDYGKRDIGFMVVDKGTYDKIVEDISNLNEEEMDVPSYDEDNRKVLYGGRDWSEPIPEVVNILEKYDVVYLEYKSLTSQVIETENCTFIFGRTDAMLKYNKNDIDFNRFIIRRENGEEITLTREMAGELWHVSNMDLLNCRHWSQIKKDGHVNSQFNYGFILGADEKVTIEIDGQIYE